VASGYVPLVPADGVLDVGHLRRLAADFDRISGRDRYSAGEFVAWLAGEADYTRQRRDEPRWPPRPAVLAGSNSGSNRGE
jgi:hypothetical protein